MRHLYFCEDVCRQLRQIFCACVFLFLAAQGSLAQEVIELDTPEVVADEAQVQVIGGEPQSPANWPATYVFRNSSGGGCTATAVGPRVVLTAAHCMKDGTIGRVKTSLGEVRISCNHHPDYRLDFTADFALCSANRDLPSPYEVVNIAAALPTEGQEIFLLGFGCRMEGGGDKNFGQLFGGVAKVIRTLSPNTNYIRTAGGAAVCFGDSGGGAYAFDQTGTRRKLFGINSRGDISTYSSLSATATDTFIDWATAWMSENGGGICGLAGEVVGCAQSF